MSLFTAVLAGPLPSEASLVKSSIVEQFKKATESPPTSGTIIYRAKLPPDILRAQPMETGLQGSTNFQYYVVRWQSNAFCFAAIRDPKEPDSTLLSETSAWRLNNEYWIVDRRRAIAWINPDSARALELPGKSPQNPVLTFFVLCRMKLDLLLNLGIYNILPAKVKWSGDTVHAVFEERNQLIDGQLRVADSGRPIELDLNYRSGTNAANYAVRYGYDATNGNAYFPSSIRIAEVMGNTEAERDNIAVIAANFENRHADAVFDPRPLIASNQLSVFHYTNSNFYSLDQNGRLQQARLEKSVGSLPSTPTTPFLAMAITLGFAFLLLGRRYAKEGNKQNHQWEKI